MHFTQESLHLRPKMGHIPSSLAIEAAATEASETGVLVLSNRALDSVPGLGTCIMYLILMPYNILMNEVQFFRCPSLSVSSISPPTA